MSIQITKASYLNLGRCSTSPGGTGSSGPPALIQALRPPGDHLGGAVLFFELAGDANTGGIASAGTVQIDLALGRHEFAERLKLFAQPVGLDADGVLDALGGRVVVAVGADIGDDEDLVVGRGLEALVQLFGGDALDIAEAVFMQRAAEQPEHVEQDRCRDGGGREVADAHRPSR